MGFESTYHWEKPIETGIIFGSVLALLVSICYYSLISVAAYSALTLLLVSSAEKMISATKNVLAKEIAKICLEAALQGHQIWRFFRQLGDCLLCAVFLKIRYRSSPIFWSTSLFSKSYVF
jgi:hypothetical protein